MADCRPQFLEHPYDPFNGAGAAEIGGRWNIAGVPLVYLAGSIALATLEVLVNSRKLDSLVGRKCSALRYTPDDVTDFIVQTDLGQPDWEESVAFGNEWIRRRKTPVLRVPSAVIPLEQNFLRNPEHPEFPRILATASEWKPLPIDSRLLQVK